MFHMFFCLFILFLNNLEVKSCRLANGTIIVNNVDLNQRCVECQLLGAYINSSTCVYPTIPDYVSIPAVQELSTVCDRSPTLYCMQFGICVPCKFGAFADECNNNGYLEEDTVRLGFLKCTCYDYVQSVGRTCQKRTNNTETSVVTLYYGEEVECIPHQHKDLGYYKTPETCLTSYLGPPPGELAIEISFPRQTCNQIGLYTAEGFKVCHGNGDWNQTTNSCDCYENFNAAIIAYNVLDGTPVYSCSVCYGPWYPSGQCDLIFSQDILGDYRECSGRGLSSNGNCICYSNAEQGYFKITQLKKNYFRTYGTGVTVTNENVIIETCWDCDDAHEGIDCKSEKNKTVSPTFQPTSSPTINFWSIEELCKDTCFWQYQGAAIIANTNKRVNASLLLPADANNSFHSICFNTTIFTTQSDGTVIVQNPNETTTLFFHSLGIEVCYLLDCKIFSWLTSESLDSVVYSFYNDTSNIVPVSNPLGGISNFCKLSESPTRMPTSYPTFYPTSTVYPTISPTRSPSRSPTTFCSTCEDLCILDAYCVGTGELQFTFSWSFSQSRRRRLQVTDLNFEVFPPSLGTIVNENHVGADNSTAWGKMDYVDNPSNVYWSSLETGYSPPEGSYNVCVRADALALPVNYTIDMYINNKQLFDSVNGTMSTEGETTCFIFVYLTPIKIYMTSEVTDGNFWNVKETMCHEEFGSDSFFYGIGYNRSYFDAHQERPVESGNGTLLVKRFEDFQTGNLLTTLYDAGLRTRNEVWMGLTENAYDYASMSCEHYSNSSYESISKTASGKTISDNWEVLGSISDDVCTEESMQMESFRHCNISLPILCVVIP